MSDSLDPRAREVIDIGDGLFAERAPMRSRDRNALTAARAREVLSYDPETGVMLRLQSRQTTRLGPCGSPNREGRLTIVVDRRRYFASRLAWLITYGEWPKGMVDHVNGDPSDNRLCNLRECTASENQQNRALHARNKTGFPGVSFDKSRNKYFASICVGLKLKNLGRYETPEEAFAAYCEAKKVLHPRSPKTRGF